MIDIAMQRLGQLGTLADDLIEQRPVPFMPFSYSLRRLPSSDGAADLALSDHTRGREEGVTTVPGHA